MCPTGDHSTTLQDTEMKVVLLLLTVGMLSSSGASYIPPRTLARCLHFNNCPRGTECRVILNPQKPRELGIELCVKTKPNPYPRPFPNPFPRGK
ncbi:hypothetical protein QR680_014086 [Steinernema hermaphroditum]|uniref:Uncharacterized protein n=1 Tax=Steinernema hermaphroditum TaxID=289476 RepID=A0AA39M2L4_9BILA|nr:hypothetical protein QR680_014086 [Steinernema hermaphroditum]